MLLCEEDKDYIRDLLGEVIVIEVYKDSEKIWSCNGDDSEFAKKHNIYAQFGNINIEDIVHGLLEILGKSKR